MNHKRRGWLALSVLVVLLGAAMVKLVVIQGVDGRALANAGLELHQSTVTQLGLRGAITDRDGSVLAMSVAGKGIGIRPSLVTDDPPLTAAEQAKAKAGQTVRPVLTAAQKRAQIVAILVKYFPGQINPAAALQSLVKPKTKIVYLVNRVLPDPAVAATKDMAKMFDTAHQNAVVLDDQEIRQYPDGDIVHTLIGSTVMGENQLAGASGIEAKLNPVLTGKNGSKSGQTDSTGTFIPGTMTVNNPAVNGSDVQLTLDTNLQYQAGAMLKAQVAKTNSKGGCVVIKGVTDGQIYALNCYNSKLSQAQIGDPAITNPFEPGSVNKVVTFAAALDKGLITPDTKIRVPETIQIGGHVVHDAWGHGWVDMSATGILAKSSNVGTLKIAQELGPDAFAAQLARMGLGTKTGIELPGEASGSVPPQKQWSATSFANLPIGQGLSMTMLQLVDMYQAIGNNGVMISPTIVAGTSKDGTFTANSSQTRTQVMKSTTANTLKDMLRATMQGGGWDQDGTGKLAAITGYQVAGKTGTAQQVDTKTKAYSQTATNSTFAGIVPADHPKFAIAIWLDDPANGGEGGDNAAPLFHDIASYAMREANVAPSASAAPVYRLYYDWQN